MTKKCDSTQRCTGSARCSKISCAKCLKSFHLKCVGLCSNQLRAIRDCPGTEWFCPACRMAPNQPDQNNNNPVFAEILHRIASLTRLVGVQIDATRSMCRSFGVFAPRLSNFAQSASTAPPAFTTQPACAEPPAPVFNEQRVFDEEINNLEFSNFFNTIVNESGIASGNNKRDRSSSLSSSRLSSSLKRTKVDVPVNTSSIPETIISPVTASASHEGISNLPAYQNELTATTPATVQNTVTTQTYGAEINTAQATTYQASTDQTSTTQPAMPVVQASSSSSVPVVRAIATTQAAGVQVNTDQASTCQAPTSQATNNQVTTCQATTNQAFTTQVINQANSAVQAFTSLATTTQAPIIHATAQATPTHINEPMVITADNVPVDQPMLQRSTHSGISMLGSFNSNVQPILAVAPTISAA